MERVLGIGGYFVRASDPTALATWYRDVLGLETDGNGMVRQEPGPLVFATFASDSEYFGSLRQQTMLNLRVRDLDAIWQQLETLGANVDPVGVQAFEGAGRFAWVVDPEGNRVELWEPQPAG